jgi:P27 family predicted phage terminase small subunit
MPKKPPKELQTAGQTLWNDALKVLEFNPLELNVLAHACAAADEAQNAKSLLEREGYTIVDARGKKIANPMYLVLRDSRNCLARLLRQLEPKRRQMRIPRNEGWGTGL